MMGTRQWVMLSVTMVLALARYDSTLGQDSSAKKGQLTIAWADNFLSVRGDDLPGGLVRTNYLEAYCRPGSTDRDWGQTVIGHRTELTSVSDDARVIQLRDTLNDGVIVTHTITAGTDEIDFRLVAHNPTNSASLTHWAQPCMRVDKFTGCTREDAFARVPQYARHCFVFLDGKLARLPTQPWATKARYIPGQVYCPADVDRNDVNPRPLSELVPDNGLVGCFSADSKKILAVAWEPYQELFQGVVTCIHSDFRIGGLKPSQTKKIRGKMYITGADIPALLNRYRSDFPEHVTHR